MSQLTLTPAFPSAFAIKDEALQFNASDVLDSLKLLSHEKQTQLCQDLVDSKLSEDDMCLIEKHMCRVQYPTIGEFLVYYFKFRRHSNLEIESNFGKFETIWDDPVIKSQVEIEKTACKWGPYLIDDLWVTQKHYGSVADCYNHISGDTCDKLFEILDILKAVIY